MGFKQAGSEQLEAKLSSSVWSKRVRAVLESNLTEGANTMRQNIETRGTGKTWSRAWGGRGRTASTPGRVDSGAMVGDVQGVVTSETPGRVVGELGWPEGSPEYYRHQEHGFRHVLTQEDVTEMRALRDAADETTPAILDGLREIARS